jgi:hypothetical protein
MLSHAMRAEAYRQGFSARHTFAHAATSRWLHKRPRPLPVMTADSGRWPGQSSVRGRLLKTAPGQGSENQADDGEQRRDWQSEAVPERRLDWEQPKLQQGSRAFASPQ